MSEELHAKYQKLATAYAEVKQKNAVLKSAVQELTQKQGQGSAGWFGFSRGCGCAVLLASPLSPSVLFRQLKLEPSHLASTPRTPVAQSPAPSLGLTLSPPTPLNGRRDGRRRRELVAQGLAAPEEDERGGTSAAGASAGYGCSPVPQPTVDEASRSAPGGGEPTVGRERREKEERDGRG
eukprot:m.309452 g.309452  ORF g.309452 m.309452 type:complete len:180 (+) comp27425_c0_seq19:61-600(+)